MPRKLQSELLDSLPHEHPDALHNRRDLRLTNQIMGNHRWLARTLRRLVQTRDTLLEIGAGTGELGGRLAERDLTVDGLDLWPRPADWPAARRWHVADLRAFDGYAHYNVIFGNLIFHQFSDADLAAFGARIRGTTRLFVACETTRRRISQVLYRMPGPLFGASHVSLHDGHVSIAAGFQGEELPTALQFPVRDWQIECRTTALGAYHLIAERQS